MLIPKYNLSGRTKEQLVDWKVQHIVIPFYQETLHNISCKILVRGKLPSDFAMLAYRIGDIKSCYVLNITPYISITHSERIAMK